MEDLKTINNNEIEVGSKPNGKEEISRGTTNVTTERVFASGPFRYKGS